VLCGGNALKYAEFLTDLYLPIGVVLYFGHFIEILSIIMPRLILFLVTIPCILLLYWPEDKGDSKEIISTQESL